MVFSGLYRWVHVDHLHFSTSIRGLSDVDKVHAGLQDIA